MKNNRFSFQISYHGSECEDAPLNAAYNCCMVFDGCGGAGADCIPITTQEGEKEYHTNAYFGARVASECVHTYVQTHYDALCEGNADYSVFTRELKEYIYQAFQDAAKKQELPVAFTKPLYPTTMVMAVLISGEKSEMSCTGDICSADRVLVIWAGDSRAFMLSPDKGLQMLTMDDADGAEASMGSEDKMNNRLEYKSGQIFHLNYAVFTINKPCLIFCCSDGCTDYFASPMHFEKGMLTALLGCADEKSVAPDDSAEYNHGTFGASLSEQIQSELYSEVYDDTTMDGFIVGSLSTDELQLFRNRLAEVSKLVQTMDNAMEATEPLADKLATQAKAWRIKEKKLRAELIEQLTAAIVPGSNNPLHEFLLGSSMCQKFLEECQAIAEDQLAADTEMQQLTAQEEQLRNQLSKECAKTSPVRDVDDLVRAIDVVEVVSDSDTFGEPDDQKQKTTFKSFLHLLKSKIGKYPDEMQQIIDRTVEQQQATNKKVEDFLDEKQNGFDLPPTMNALLDEYRQINSAILKKQKNTQSAVVTTYFREFYNFNKLEFLKELIRQENEMTPEMRASGSAIVDVFEVILPLCMTNDEMVLVQHQIDAIWHEYKDVYHSVLNSSIVMERGTT